MRWMMYRWWCEGGSDRAWLVIESVFLRSPDKGYWACLGDIPPDMPRRPETWATYDTEIAFKILFIQTNSKGERSGMRRRSSKGIYWNLLTRREGILLSNVRLLLLLMMVSKMQLLTKGLHVLWRVRVFTREVCSFCNGDKSEETLHEVTCTEVTMMIVRSDSITGCQRCQSYRN